jgi:hypothetical protein
MNFLNIIRKASPFLGTAISLAVPGPLGAMASSLLTKALSLPTDAKQDAIAAAIVGMTPEQAVALKTAEETFAMQMRQMDITSVEDMTKLAYDDTKDARAMKIQTKSMYPEILSTIIVGAYITLSALTYLRVLPEGQKAEIDQILEMTKMLVVLVAGFWFGSSSGDARKTEIISQAEPVK